MACVLPTGCTVAQTFTIPNPRDEIEALFISYEQGNLVLVEKSIDDCVFDTETDESGEVKYLVTTELSQEDTLKFRESCPSGASVKIQLRIKLTNGARMKSQVITLRADELIKKGEI